MLDPEDDAATVNWGGAWRMPTNDEFSELKNNCTWEYTKQNGVEGYKVTGPSGNSIFLPMGGYKNHDSFYGGNGYYWSSSLSIDHEHLVFHLLFSVNGQQVRTYGCERYYGLLVRPVCQ